MKKAIVLLSGGLDSSVTLYYAKKKNYKVYCLVFDYGQRHLKEIESARKIAKLAEVKYTVLKLALPKKAGVLLDKKTPLPKRSLLKLKEKANIPATYVPGRNIIFLSYALSYAEAIDADSIFIGANAIDYSGYPDCRPEFLKAFMRISKVATKRGVEGNPVRILAPLIKKSKVEIVKLGKRLNVPFEYTWSCYKGLKYPCGYCDSCRLRAKGFKEAGFKDPLYAERQK